MKTRFLWIALVLVVGVLSALSCRRSDIRTLIIDVPQMADARDVRIVTNAALDEMVGRYDSIQNAYEVDLSKKLVLYHESPRLFAPEYQRRIEARIADVGFTARVTHCGLNPPTPVPTVDGPKQMWPNRITAVISVPDMKDSTDANIIVDAIAFARVGHDDPRIQIHSASRRLVLRYESLCLSLKNMEYAIAHAGFDANTTPARLGAKDSLPHGWTPVQL